MAHDMKENGSAGKLVERGSCFCLMETLMRATGKTIKHQALVVLFLKLKDTSASGKMMFTTGRGKSFGKMDLAT